MVSLIMYTTEEMVLNSEIDDAGRMLQVVEELVSDNVLTIDAGIILFDQMFNYPLEA